MSINFEIKGMEALVTAVGNLGKLPRKCVRGAARKASNIALKAARAGAPVFSGNVEDWPGVIPGALKKGIIKSEERSRNPSKAVFDIKMDPKKNNIFVKMYNGERWYYPASQEFGYIGLDGRKHPGKHFFERSLTEHKAEIEAVTIEELTKRIDAEWAKG
jgi:HK97 gp10 family phage protein